MSTKSEQKTVLKNRSRDPSDYYLKYHARNRAKNRGIDLAAIGEAIAEGEPIEADQGNRWGYEYDTGLGTIRVFCGFDPTRPEHAVLTAYWVDREGRGR